MLTLTKKLSILKRDPLSEKSRSIDLVLDTACKNNLLCERLEGKKAIEDTIHMAHYGMDPNTLNDSEEERKAVIYDLKQLTGFKTYQQYWGPRLVGAGALLITAALGSRALNVNSTILRNYAIPVAAAILFLAKGKSSAGYYASNVQKARNLDKQIEELGWSISPDRTR